MAVSRIPFGKPYVAGKEFYYIAQAVMSGTIAGDGTFTKMCQHWLESNLRTPKALLTTSCTTALEMAAILSDVKSGDEVIMPSFTFVSTANAFVLRGATPVFVDIRSDTLNIDETKVESAITSKTRAIVAVHYAGHPCAMDTLKEIAARNNIMLIEDAAQAILSYDQDSVLGSIGNLGCLSFHETKNVIAGEGGALLINDEKLIERAEIIWQKGTNRKAFLSGLVDKYTWVDIGSSFLPNELTAAFLYAQLENAESINQHRRDIYKRYYDTLYQLEKEGYLQLPMSRPEHSNGHMFYVLCRNPQERFNLINYMRDNGIMAVFHYIPLHSSPAGLKYSRTHGKLEVTESISSRLLRLPMYSDLSLDSIPRIVNVIKSFFTEQSQK
jgi:dTDP-4-amino-4,6-dideoxygalactose transaminase